MFLSSVLAKPVGRPRECLTLDDTRLNSSQLIEVEARYDRSVIAVLPNGFVGYRVAPHESLLQRRGGEHIVVLVRNVCRLAIVQVGVHMTTVLAIAWTSREGRFVVGSKWADQF